MGKFPEVQALWGVHQGELEVVLLNRALGLVADENSNHVSLPPGVAIWDHGIIDKLPQKRICL
jgi:hypothetical protein